MIIILFLPLISFYIFQDPIKGFQTENYLDEDTKEKSLGLHELMDDLFSLFISMEKDTNFQKPLPSVPIIPLDYLNLGDNKLAAKAFEDLKVYLKKPLEDIANSESSSCCLENALKFLSSWSSGNGASLEALKATIDSLLQNLLNILSSFKQASATIDKLAVLEKKQKSINNELPQRKEAANTLEKSIAEAQQKEADLEENFFRLQAELKSVENEIKEHEVLLLSLKDQEKKLHMDTVNFSKEFEFVKRDKLKMVEDESKAQEQLFKAKYEWLAFCNQLKQNCSTAWNLF